MSSWDTRGDAPEMANVLQMRLPGMSWIGELTRGEKGPHSTVANASIVMGCDTTLSVIMAYDEFSYHAVVTRAPPVAFQGAPPLRGPYPRAVADEDITLIQSYIQRTYGLRIGQPVAHQAVAVDAMRRRIHPVRDWLQSLVWDGVPRVDGWLDLAFGAGTSDYCRAIGTKFLCAAVRRILQPGVKFDTVLILEGDQDAGKSRACAALFGQEWFTDNLSGDLAGKDSQQGMSGKWGIELAELNAFLRSTNQAAKAFFSRQVDYFRPPYGKSFIERPRQCVFIATTNEPDYLGDSTGNRRYWPIVCRSVRVEWIAEFREQLWAEAVVIEAQGHPLWLTDDATRARALGHQAKRLAEDVWRPAVRDWIAMGLRSEVRIPDVLHHALAIPRHQQNRSAEMRVAALLRSDGWVRHIYTPRGGKTLVAWFAPGVDLPGKPPRGNNTSD